jgi:hypothetical protein
MARPYKGYRAARAAFGETPRPHDAAQYDRWRSPVLAAVATPGAALEVAVHTSVVVPDGSAATVTVDWDGAGVLAPVPSTGDVAHTYATPGEKTIVVVAKAADGFTATKTLVVTAAA